MSSVDKALAGPRSQAPWQVQSVDRSLGYKTRPMKHGLWLHSRSPGGPHSCKLHYSVPKYTSNSTSSYHNNNILLLYIFL
jgi:hypothetical protein